MPRHYDFLWDLPDDETGNVRHLAEHGLTPEDVEHAFSQLIGEDVSRSSGLPLVYGTALDGRIIVVVYEEVDESTLYVVTAYHPGKN